MKKAKVMALSMLALVVIGVSVVNADMLNPRQPVTFFGGHTHDAEGTHGAPSHGGGLDKYGCHNKSVPYHCH